MFDGIKILNALTDVEALKQNPWLDWKLHVPERTGEIESQTSECTNLRFMVKGTNVHLQGSLHKYANEGTHNANDFRADQVATTITDLWERFGISENSLLNNVEFGVNVCTPFAPKDFLQRLICHKGTPFVKIIDDGVHYYQCQHEHFILKVYDKGTQYRLPFHLLRFEVKVLKMQFLATKGVSLKRLGDLTNTANYERLGETLRAYFDEILIDEPKITADALNQSQRELINTGRNPKTWTRPQREDFENTTNYDRARKEQTRRLEKFKQLLHNHPQAEHWQQTTAQLIADKWAELSGKNCPKFTAPISPESCPKFTNSQGNTAPEQNGAIVPNLPFILNVNLGQTGQTQTMPETKVCKVTGIDISDQKTDSLFVGETTLRNDPDLLQSITKQHRRKRENEPFTMPPTTQPTMSETNTLTRQTICVNDCSSSKRIQDCSTCPK